MANYAVCGSLLLTALVCCTNATSVFRTYDGRLYELRKQHMTWVQGHHYALSQTRTHNGKTVKGHLATVTSDGEFSFVASMCNGSPCYIGGIDHGTNLDFFWMIGPDAGLRIDRNSKYWRQGEPNDHGQEEGCILVNGYANGYWDDFPCTRFPHQYFTLVEYEEDPVGQGWAVFYNNHLYQFVNEPKRADQALAIAEARTYHERKGYLATISDGDEELFIRTFVDIHNRMYIAASDFDSEGQWKWASGPEEGQPFWQGKSDGRRISYAAWASGEPNDYGNNEDCAEATYHGWNDIDCATSRGFIVEYGGICTPSCHSKAKCVAQRTKDVCVCLEGWAGNGYSCLDVDECRENTYDCPANSVCRNEPGSYRCECDEGFVKSADGKTCDEIDACQSDPCMDNAICENESGKFSCRCRPGYQLVNGACKDIDQCAQHSHNCDLQTQTCENLPGGYRCPCRAGFEEAADGSCVDENECLQGDICPAHASCVNQPGGYDCPCVENYVKDESGTCQKRKVDECDAGTDNCGSHSTCQDTENGFLCICDTGFTGGDIDELGTFSCVDVNECQSSPCHDNAICENLMGTFSCACPDGYSGDGFDCTKCATSCQPEFYLSGDCTADTTPACVACDLCPEGKSKVGGCIGSENTICQDLEKPVVILNGESPFYVAFGATFEDPGAAATDSFDGDLTDKVVITGAASVDTNQLGTYSVSYSVRDAAGNSNSVTRTVIVEDNIDPVITLLGDAEVTVQTGETYIDDGVKVEDNVDGDITSLVIATGLPISTAKPGTHTVVYRVHDSSDNSAEETRTVIVVDKTSPELVLHGELTVVIEAGSQFFDPGVRRAYDNVDGSLLGSVKKGVSMQQVGQLLPVNCGRGSPASDVTAPSYDPVLDRVDTFAPSGSVYAITYSVTDSSSNTASVTRTVKIEDGIPPSPFTSLPRRAGLAYKDEDFAGIVGGYNVVRPSDIVASAIDARDGDTSNRICTFVDVYANANTRRPLASGGLDLVKLDRPIGTVFSVSFTVTDAAGNRAALGPYQIPLIDAKPPGITLKGDVELVLEVAEPYVEPGYTATDDVDGDLTHKVKVASTFDPMLLDDQKIVYEVRDSSGNLGSAERTVVMQFNRPAFNFLLGLLLRVQYSRFMALRQQFLDLVEEMADGFPFLFSQTDLSGPGKPRVSIVIGARYKNPPTRRRDIDAKYPWMPADVLRSRLDLARLEALFDIIKTEIVEDVDATVQEDDGSSAAFLWPVVGSICGLVGIVLILLLAIYLRRRNREAFTTSDRALPQFSNPLFQKADEAAYDSASMASDGYADLYHEPSTMLWSESGAKSLPDRPGLQVAPEPDRYLLIEGAELDDIDDETFEVTSVPSSASASAVAYARPQKPSTQAQQSAAKHSRYNDGLSEYDLASKELPATYDLAGDDGSRGAEYEVATKLNFAPEYDHAQSAEDPAYDTATAAGAPYPEELPGYDPATLLQEPTYDEARQVVKVDEGRDPRPSNAQGRNDYAIASGSSPTGASHYDLATTTSVSSTTEPEYDIATNNSRDQEPPEYALATMRGEGTTDYDLASSSQHDPAYDVARPADHNDPTASSSYALADRHTKPGHDAASEDPAYAVTFGSEPCEMPDYDEATLNFDDDGPSYAIASAMQPPSAEPQYDVATPAGHTRPSDYDLASAADDAPDYQLAQSDHHAAPEYDLATSQDDDVPDYALASPSAQNADVKQSLLALVSQPRQLEACEWFHGSLSREQTESMLASGGAGTYLCRRSKSTSGLVVSVLLASDRCIHHLLTFKDTEWCLNGQPIAPKTATFSDIISAIQGTKAVRGLKLHRL